MDHLQEYGDSSDSDSVVESSPVTQNVHNAMPTNNEVLETGNELTNTECTDTSEGIDKNVHFVVLSKSMQGKLEEERHDPSVSISSDSFNFFNLQPQPEFSEDSNSHVGIQRTSAPHNLGNKRVKVVVSDKEIELPDGDFWSNFKPDESSVANNPNHQISHEDYYSWQLGTSGSSKSNRKRGNSRASDSKVYDSSKNTDYHQSHSPLPITSDRLISQDGNHSFHVSQTFVDSSFPESSSAKQARKCFYIHSKISPFLFNNSTRSRCASTVSQSWSAENYVVNRINWNIPNYSHLLLTAGKHGMKGDVSIWNVWSTVDYLVTSFSNHTKAVKHAEWLQNGREILSCSYDRTAHVTDVETGKVLHQCEHAGFVTSGCCHPSNPRLFFTGTEDMVLMWDERIADVPVKHFAFKQAFGQVQDLVVIQDGRELISCSDLVSRDSADRNIMAWDIASTVVLSNQIFQERYSCTRLKKHPGNQHFLAQTQGGYVAIFSTTKPYKLYKSKRFDGHKMHGYSIGFDVTSDGRMVYSGSAEGGLHCYDFNTGRLQNKLSNQKNDVIIDVACHPVLPSLVATSTWGGKLSLCQ